MRFIDFNLHIVILCLLLFIGNFVGCRRMRNDSTGDNEKLQRDELPIKVSDETWKVFQEIIKIQNIEIEFDPTWRNSTVSKNVKAQFWVLPSEFKIGINIYDKNITEETLIHEALHAKYCVNGYPCLFLNKFPVKKEISNLSNSIDHIEIFNYLENIGFNPRKDAQQEWTNSIKLLDESINRFPPNASLHVLKIMGAINTFDALVKGVNEEVIKENLHHRIIDGFDLGINIFNEIQQYDLSKIDEKFDAFIRICSILGLTKNNVVIGKLDFYNRKRSYFDPNIGLLLEAK